MASKGIIDVRESRELLATIYAIRAVDKTLQKIIRRETKAIAQPEWKKALAERADTRLEHRALVDTAVTTISNQNVRMQSASKGRALSGGFQPKVDYHAAEYGADQSRQITYQRTTKGNRHTVTRRLGNTLKSRNRRGYVFTPAAREMVPRLAALWVQTTVRTIATALEGKEE